MFNIVHKSPEFARKEGKLKSYKSCVDVHAWSHDDDRRSTYLRDWIKKDSPVCVLPVRAITRCLRIMTRRGVPIAPPCCPTCRSKALLDNIYKSCHAIKECLKSEGEFQKFFVNEELETSHWPCEKCVDVLKSIKLFWNIILEKLLNIACPTNENLDCLKTKSVDEFSKEWKDEIVEQTRHVKNLQSLRRNHINDSQKSNKVINSQGRRSVDHNNVIYNDIFNKDCKIYKDKATNTNFLCQKRKIKHNNKSQNVGTAVEKRDISCNTSCRSLNYLSKKDLICLKNKLDMQETLIKQLQNKINDLKLESKNKTEDIPSNLIKKNVLDSSTDIETNIDDDIKDQFETIKDIASEMIITLKNCTDKSYRNISVLQVLHKSNMPPAEENEQIDDNNPIRVLNRVHDTFNAIVGRELCIAKENKNYRIKKTRTSYHHEMDRISVSKTGSSSTASKFKSANGL